MIYITINNEINSQNKLTNKKLIEKKKKILIPNKKYFNITISTSTKNHAFDDKKINFEQVEKFPFEMH